MTTHSVLLRSTNFIKWVNFVEIIAASSVTFPPWIPTHIGIYTKIKIGGNHCKKQKQVESAYKQVWYLSIALPISVVQHCYKPFVLKMIKNHPKVFCDWSNVDANILRW